MRVFTVFCLLVTLHFLSKTGAVFALVNGINGEETQQANTTVYIFLFWQSVAAVS